MAFSPYKRAPRLLSLFNVGPRECPPTVTSTWFTELPPDAKISPKDYLSLGITAPPVTTSSSFIDHSRIPKWEKLNLPKELVDAAKSFSLFLSPNDEASVTKSSVINRTALPIRFIPPKKAIIHPTCEDALAALVTEPVNKKKRTKRVKCEQVESNHANEQLQIVCWDPSANEDKEPDKKKRKVPPKVDCGPVVKNEVTERLQKFITDEMNGSDLKLVIQKVLFMSDLKPDQNRLLLPRKQLITEDFLSDDEKSILESEEIEVRIVGPTLKMYKEPMRLKRWSMSRSENFVLKTKWKQFVEENKDYLEQLSIIQLWSFREDQQLCFALAVVKGPPSGVNIVV